MTAKEISVFIIGLILVGFLYLLKHPLTPQSDSFTVSHADKTIGIDIIPEQQTQGFNPTTIKTSIEDILDIPAWTFDLTELEESTSEELVKNIQQTIEDQKYIQPEKDNVLYYWLILKSIDAKNPLIATTALKLNEFLANQTNDAIEQNDETLLTKSIATMRTIDDKNPSIKALQNKLATIKTINKLYKKGVKQIQNNQIVSVDSQDAWHTAKQLQNIDHENDKSILLTNQVNNFLIATALRAAEETDFNLASSQIQQAQLLSPDSNTVSEALNQIEELKQKRYVWLEQQINQAINQANVQRAEKLQNQLADLGIAQSQLNEYTKEINRVKLFGTFKPFDAFNDRTKNQQNLPTMVVMPIGDYQMGYAKGPKHEKPVHQVHFKTGFAVSKNEITVNDFSLFIKNSKYTTDAESKKSSKIYDINTGRLRTKNRINWQKDFLGKKADKLNPVIHVSWNDAHAYTLWLSNQTGKNYRLLSESEFEYILKAGTKSIYPWGNNDPIQVTENLTGKKDKFKGNNRIKWNEGFEDYNDGYWGPAPVGSFIPNQFQLNDTAGNVMEWVTDCWHDSYTRAPINGKAWSNPGCEDHVIRGGSWSSAKNEYRSSHRFKAKSNFTDPRLGFRIAVDLK